MRPFDIGNDAITKQERQPADTLRPKQITQFMQAPLEQLRVVLVRHDSNESVQGRLYT